MNYSQKESESMYGSGPLFPSDPTKSVFLILFRISTPITIQIVKPLLASLLSKANLKKLPIPKKMQRKHHL